MSISGWLVRWLKINPPASASTKPPMPAKSSDARSSSRNACVGAQSCSSTRWPISVAAIAKQRECAFDEFAVADRLQLGETPLALPQTAGRESDDIVLLFRCAQAAADQTVARDQVDVRARNLRELLRHAIVERESERDGAQHFRFGEFRGL